VLETAAQAGILDPQVLRWSLKALLCGRGEEWRRFDRLFDAYFLPPNRSLFVPGKGGGRVSPAEHDTPDSRAADATTRADGSAAAGDFAPTRHSSLEIESSRASGYGITGDLDHGAARQGASRGESLASTDFRDLNQAQQTYEIEQLMRRFSKRLKRCDLRREAAAHHGRRLDLQATIRRSVASGGTPMQLAWKRRRRDTSAPHIARRCQPIDEPLWVLLHAPSSGAVPRIGRGLLLHFPHAPDRGERGARRPGSMALAAAAASACHRLGRRHANRRVLAGIQP
jgi:uncharacterized protein with von Willebrand factor type A (vWA) domain